MNVRDQSAIVTGGASGLGAATALLLAREGAKVAIIDVNLDGAQVLAQQISGLAIGCDVADATAVEEALASARQVHGAARILVNCAGIGSFGRITTRNGPMPLDEFRRVIDVNLVGTFNTLRLAAAAMAGLPAFEDGERGVVVSTASIAAYEGQIGQAAYAASKGAVVSLTLPAARELAQFGIRVLAIAPGFFKTPFMDYLPAEVHALLADSVPFPQRYGMPEEFASLVLHIIANRALNGEVIRLDGAFRLPPWLLDGWSRRSSIRED